MNKPEPAAPASGGFPEETICPSCGRFVGAYTRCPYCGSEHRRRMSIRFFRIFALVVAIGGVFLIWLAARGVKAPLIKIGEIGPMQSFAYVRVEGENTRTRTYDDGGVGFWVSDGTGILNVRAYADTGKEMLAKGLVPGPGDRVSAEGTLNFREDRATMIVNVPEKVSVERVRAKKAAIASLGEEQAGRKVVVEGTITGVRNFPKGSSFRLSDGTASVEVVLWDSNRALFGEKEKLLARGRAVAVQGKVGAYRGALQLNLELPGDITETGAATALTAADGTEEASEFQKMDIGDLTDDMMAKAVEVSGKVMGLRKFPKGVALELTDPTGSVEVVVWNSVAGDMADADALLAPGKLLKVRGRVGEYKKKLQVIPSSAAQVEETRIAD